MTVRPPPSETQGPTRLYAAIAPSMGADEIAALVTGRSFRRSGAWLYLTEFDLIRIGVDRLAAVFGQLPRDEPTETFPVILHFRGTGEDYREPALAALMHAVATLKPDAVALEPPGNAVDPEGKFLRELRTRLDAFTGPTPHLYWIGAAARAFVLHPRSGGPSHAFYIRISSSADAKGRRASFRTDMDALFGQKPSPSLITEGVVVRLEGAPDDEPFLVGCRQYLDELQDT